MKEINGFDKIEAKSGEFRAPVAGGYICTITHVEDVPINESTGKGDYLKVEYDISEGEFKNYYTELFQKFGRWNASFLKSYKEKAYGLFKHFINCVEQSNVGWTFTFQTIEKDLVGQKIGLVLGEEEYKNSAGETKTKLAVKYIKTVDDITDGRYSVPDKKKLVQEAIGGAIEWNDPLDDVLPF